MEEINNYFVGVKNLREVNPGVMLEAVKIRCDKGSVVYAKFTEDADSVFISGNIGASICAIGELIVMISKKSNVSIPTLIKAIINNIQEEI